MDHPLIGALGSDRLRYVDLARAEELGADGLLRAPRAARLLVEAALRRACSPGGEQNEAAITAALRSAAGFLAPRTGPDVPPELGFLPTRVLMQDHSGVPVLADLASMRALLAERGLDPKAVAPVLPVDLVVDHSVEADSTRVPDAVAANMAREYRLNAERYRFLRWAQQAFTGLSVIPPGHGIVHQMHLEHLARVVMKDHRGFLAPDTVLGTDSHTPMVNSLGVLGWGVGGIEATLAVLGTPVPLRRPEFVGVRLVGAPPPEVAATDVALTLTAFLRRQGVVGAFVEFHGPGVNALDVPDRATIANMAPEYGCTSALFPVDHRTLSYLRMTGRGEQHIELVEEYTTVQGLFGQGDAGGFDRDLEFDLSAVRTSAAGPRRPQELLRLDEIGRPGGRVDRRRPGDGAVVLAAITSCTNTSNPRAMIAAGLLAAKAVERGLSTPDWVKTSTAPGSRAVTAYLAGAGLLPALEKLGFAPVGYGCTTCIGNSGELHPVAAAAAAAGVRTAAVLSGNRNFEGRIHSAVTDAYLMSPALVVAHAIAGTVDIDLTKDALGTDHDGAAVRLADIWPDRAEIDAVVRTIGPEYFKAERATLHSDARWNLLSSPSGESYDWPAGSTYLVRSPLVVPRPAGHLTDVTGARALVVAGESTTTDHISPAGEIGPDSLAAHYLRELGESPDELNTYGCRRGNHEVMVRGTFGNPRFRNRLAGDRSGDWTLLLPERVPARVYDAAQEYARRQVPLIVLAGRDYGMGSSRDWAAKGQDLLGIRAVLAESFERIHRSNLIGAGIVPLQFPDGVTVDGLGLRGDERFDLIGLDRIEVGGTVAVRARSDDGGAAVEWRMLVRADTTDELDYLRGGGFLRSIARRLAAEGAGGGDD